MNGRAKGLKEQRLKNAAMNTPDQESNKWLEQGGFGGLDWASENHSVVVVDSHGKVIEEDWSSVRAASLVVSHVSIQICSFNRQSGSDRLADDPF
jgi:hypothetical protein